jgi:hypothetical protein
MMFWQLFSHQDAGDIIAFAGYYISSLILAFLAVLISSIVFKRSGVLSWEKIIILNLFIISCWGIYAVSTATEKMTLALLGSESDDAAEFAYQKSFDLNLHQAIKLAVSNVGMWEEETGGQNVRFYAACRVADLLASSNGDFQNTILSQVQAAPIVTPGFFGTNSITCSFYIPCHTQPVQPVAEIIRHRLLELGKYQANTSVAGSASLTEQRDKVASCIP